MSVPRSSVVLAAAALVLGGCAIEQGVVVPEIELLSAAPDRHGHAHVNSRSDLHAQGDNVATVLLSDPGTSVVPRRVISASHDQLQESRFDEYRTEMAALAVAQGGLAGRPDLRSVVRADLDGNGTDEVVIAGELTVCDGEFCGPDQDHRRGSYAMVYLRRVVGSSARAEIVEFRIAGQEERQVPVLFVVGAGDANGDGVMEIAGGHNSFEDPVYYLWDAGTVDRKPTRIFSPDDF